MISRSSLLTACFTLAAMIGVVAETKPPVNPQAKPSLGSVEFTDPAGDVGVIITMDNAGEKKFPGFDVVKLSIVSDGKQITVSTTLQSPPAEVASSTVELYFDVDNSPKTGVGVDYTKFAGFEFRGTLDACVTLSNSMNSCAGASSTPAAKLVRRYAVVSLDRFKGAKEIDGREQVVDSAGFFNTMKAPQTPVVGTVVQAALDYAALKVAPGRTIRILVRESATHPTSTGTPQGFFPEVLLTLK